MIVQHVLATDTLNMSDEADEPHQTLISQANQGQSLNSQYSLSQTSCFMTDTPMDYGLHSLPKARKILTQIT